MSTWDEARGNIDWVFQDGGAKDNFSKAYNDDHHGLLEYIFGNQDRVNGYKNAYRSVLYAQQHNNGAWQSIKEHMGESVNYLRQLGYQAEPDF